MATVMLLAPMDMSVLPSSLTPYPGLIDPTTVEKSYTSGADLYFQGVFAGYNGIISNVIVAIGHFPELYITNLQFSVNIDFYIQAIDTGNLALAVATFLSGDDTLLGSSGNDTLLGFNGNDTMFGGPGGGAA